MYQARWNLQNDKSEAMTPLAMNLEGSIFIVTYPICKPGARFTNKMFSPD